MANKEVVTTYGNTQTNLNPLKILSAISIMAGSWSMLFEIYFFQGFEIELYVARVSFTFLAAIIFTLSFRDFGKTVINILTHILILGMISSFIFTIFMIPNTIYINSQILSLLIFTFAIIFSWEVTQQIIVAIYYNLLFAASIFYSDANIYKLPNVLSLVLFVSFISLLSVAASAVIYKNRKKYIERTNEIKFLFNNASVGIVRINSAGEILAANQYFLDLFNINNPSNTLNIFDYLAPGSNERGLLQKKLIGNLYENIEEQIKDESGNTKYLQITAKTLEIDDNPDTIECIIADKTSEKKAEREKNKALEILFEEARDKQLISQKVIEEKNEKIKLLAQINHEVRTPLNAILVYFDMIENKQIETIDEFQEFAKTVKISAESLLQIINNFIDFAKIDAGKIEIEEESTELLEELDSIVKLLGYLAEASNNKLVLNKDNIEDNLIVIDKSKYRQILINLIGNAIKFTSKGDITITALTESINDSTGKLTTVVEDTGRGIPQDLIDKIFEPFKSSSNSGHPHEKSSGLGLTICKEYVNLMGGHISATSEYGRGTTVKFTIPYKLL